MTTDIHHAVRQAEPEPSGRALFWGLVLLAVVAAIAQPFLPPRAMTDAASDLQ